MRNGFEKDKTLIFDQLSRREKSEVIDGIDHYPPQILNLHEEYYCEVRTHMKATVEVVWGAKVRQRMLKVYRENGNPLEPFQLWAKYQDVTLHLEWTSG
jgi:hypothetical protein